MGGDRHTNRQFLGRFGERAELSPLQIKPLDRKGAIAKPKKMDCIVALFDLIFLLVWGWADYCFGYLQNDLERMARLTPIHEQQRDDAERLWTHHRHRSLSGRRNGRPDAAIAQHRLQAERYEDEFIRMSNLVARNRRRTRFFRGLMPTILFFQFAWALYLLFCGISVLLIVADVL